jgi:hypothetical protein
VISWKDVPHQRRREHSRSTCSPPIGKAAPPALLSEAVSELGVDELVEALAHVANERGTGVIHIEQGPTEFAALSCGFDVIPDQGIRTVSPDGGPGHEARLLGLEDEGRGLIVKEGKPLPGRVPVRLDEGFVNELGWGGLVLGSCPQGLHVTRLWAAPTRRDAVLRQQPRRAVRRPRGRRHRSTAATARPASARM